MAEIGSADLVIVPKFKGLSEQVDKALGAAEPAASKSGEKVGSSVAGGFGGGLAKSGAVIGAFSSLATKAMDAVSAHVGSAVARFDTMNAFPAVMETLGYSAKDSEAAIGKMSDRLGNLPTTLDSMTGAVQRIVPSIKDVGRSTDVMLAFNDALVAGKGPVEIQSAAIEQFSQAVSRGKFELEEWRSVQTAMPGQLDQVAKSMLGAGAGAGDLYEALKDGAVSMEDFLDTLVRLDTEGGDGFASFMEQAETAAGGVGTSVANMGNAVTKGIAKVMDTIGEGNIAGAFDGVKGAINAAFDAVNDALGKAMPLVEKAAPALSAIAPQAVTAAAAFAGFKAVGGHLADFAGRAKDAGKESGLLAKAGALLGTSLSPVSVAVTGVSAGLGVATAAFAAAKKQGDDFRTSTEGLSKAVSDATSLDEYAGRIAGVGEKSGATAKSVSEMADTIARNVGKMDEINEAAQSQISQLSTAQGIIDDYAGATDLSAEAQGRLEWAIKLVNDQFDLSITKADVMADSYTGADGAAKDLTDSVNALIDAKKQEVRTNALTEDLSLAYENETTAASTLADAKRRLADYEAEYASKAEHSQREQDEYAIVTSRMRDEVEKAELAYEAAAEGVDALESELGDSARAASENADAFDKWGNSMSTLFVETLKQATGSDNGLGMLKDDLRALGASTEDLASLTEDELMAVAEAYDGTAASVVGELESMGVGMDEAARATAKASADVRSALEGFGDGFAEDLSGAGVDVEAFAWSLAEAGVSAERLNEVGGANIAALARVTNGSVDTMIWAIENYNSVPIVDKDGNVTLNDAELVDAQGNLYTWNGSALVDQNGNAAVDDVDLVDAQGNVYTWNGSAIEPKSTSLWVEHGTMTAALGEISVWNSFGSTLGRKTAELVTNITQNITQRNLNASGGIRMHADGGIRAHASGAFIATRAVPLDIVGEDGAEAIVPLTNRRYSQPFADIIAEGVAMRTGAGRVENNYYLDAGGLSAAGRSEVEALLMQVLSVMLREGAM